MSQLFGYESPQEMIDCITDIGAQIHLTRESRQRFVEELIKTGVVEKFEARNLKKDGTIIWTSTNARIAKDEYGATLFYEGLVTDITKQKEAEERYRTLVEKLPAVIFMDGFDNPQPTKYISPRLKELLGYNPEEWANDGSLWENSLHPEDRERVLAEDVRTNETREPFRIEYRIRHRDGHYIWVKEDSSIIHAEDGTPLYWHGILLDITDQRNSQKLARENEISYRELLNSVTQAIYIQDKEGRFLDVNDGAVKMYGYSREFFIGKTPEALSAPGKNNLDDLAKIIERAFAGESQEFEFWGRRSNGQIFPKTVTLNKGSYFGQDVIIAIAQDVTVRKQAERQLERQVKELTILRDIATAIAQCNSEDEIIGQATRITASLYPDLCGTLLLNDQGNMLKPHPSYSGTDITKWKDGYPVTDGIAGRVARTGRPIRLDNAAGDPDYIPAAPDMRSEICVPFRIHNRIIGVFNVESKQANAFDENDERLLNTIANSLGTAIEKLRLGKAEEAQRRREAVLLDLMRIAASSLDLNQVLQSILDQLMTLIPSDAGSIQLLEGDRLIISAAKGREAIEFATRGLIYLDRYPLNKHVIMEQKTVRIDDVLRDDRYIPSAGASNVRSFIGIPLIAKDRTIGMLTLDSYQPAHFTEQDEELGLAVANHTSIAIENARLFREEKRRSQIIATMADIANEIATTREIIPALDRIAEHTLSLLHASTVAVYLLQEDERTIKVVTVRGAYKKEMLSHAIQLGEGITGNIIAVGKPEIIDDVSGDPRRITVPGTPQEDAIFDTMMSAPLILHGKSIGAINAWRLKSSGLFDNSELNYLVSIAHQASVSVESARLFEETTRRAQEAAAIAEVGRSISATLNLDVVLESIARYAKELLQAETSAVYLPEQNTPLLRAISVIGSDVEEIKNDPLEVGQGILGDIALKKRGEIVNNANKDPRSIPIEGTEALLHEHIMGMPFLSKGQLTGLLVVWRIGEREEFKASDLDFLSSLAQQATVAIENARLFEAEHKHLQNTEILNRATSALANTLETHNLFETILDWLRAIVPYDSASIMMIQGKNLKLAAIRNLPRPFFVGQTLPMSKKWDDIAEMRKPIIMADAQSDPRFEKWEGSEYIRGWMGIAMFVQDKLIGFINLDSKTPGIYTGEESFLIQTYVNQAAIAIENARLFELEQKRRKDAEIIRQAATILSSLRDLPSLHEAILEWLQKIAPYDSASILELEEDHIRITAARGLPNPEKAVNQSFPKDNILCRIMTETGEPLIIEDCERDPRFERWGDVQNVRGWMGIPMITRSQVIGYLTLDSHTPNAYSLNDATAAQTFAHQAANSMENARLYTETLQRLEELEMVSRVSYALRAAHDTREMIPILLDEIKTNMETDTAAIWLYDHGKGELIPMAASGRLKDLPKAIFKPKEGIVGTVFAKGTAHISPELGKDSLITPENAGVLGNGLTGITLPIRTASETIGVLAVSMPPPRRIGPNHVRLVTTLTEIAGNAIYRSNLFERGEEQIRRLTILREMDTAITSSLDLHVTLGILTEHLLTKMGVSAAVVLVFNPNSQSLNYYAPAGFKNRESVRGSQNIGEGPAGQILLNRKAVFIKDLGKETNLPPMRSLKSEQFSSYYAIPLLGKGATKGILETYFREPFTPNPDWLDFIHALAEQAVIAIDNAQLFENLQRTNQELSLAYDTTLEGWGKALELRDKETKGHTNRVTNLTLDLARQMNIPEAELLHIRRGALLHDIGKMGVPDSILHKEGPLTESELIEMRKHPQYAYDLLRPITYLRQALDIPYSHHEWWNGSGYPQGLKGEEIPLSARIFAIIDVWDALNSDRPYRPAWHPDKVLEYIKGLSGKQFDPDVADVFCRMVEDDRNFTNPARPRSTGRLNLKRNSQ